MSTAIYPVTLLCT